MNYNEYYFIEYTIPILGILITAIAQIFINISYKKNSVIKTNSQKTGYETARKILDSNGLQNIKINQVSGKLTDHYDPRNKSINLSREVYEGTSISSVSVAAHECGHAIQDKNNYFFLKFRASLVPFVNFSSKFGYIVVILGLIFNIIGLSKFGIGLLSLILLFQLVTLPVEINASKRAEAQLLELDIIDKQEQKKSKRVLTAAALTYVASLMTTFLQLLRLVLIVLGRDDD